MAADPYLHCSPGPWKADGHGVYVFAEDEKGQFPVCDIRGWGHLTGKGFGARGLSDHEAKKIQMANARLLAAAPDLLDLARELLEYFNGKENPKIEALFEKARALGLR
jgi:hypothetical protein